MYSTWDYLMLLVCAEMSTLLLLTFWVSGYGAAVQAKEAYRKLYFFHLLHEVSMVLWNVTATFYSFCHLLLATEKVPWLWIKDSFVVLLEFLKGHWWLEAFPLMHPLVWLVWRLFYIQSKAKRRNDKPCVYTVEAIGLTCWERDIIGEVKWLEMEI